MFYISTRDKSEKVSASEAILKGLAPGGGLYVPESFPRLDRSLDELKDMSYQEIAYEVMKLFLTDFTEEELRACINAAYDEKFDDPEIAPLREKGGLWYIELFHGRTIAFKDMALSILPHLMKTAAKKNGVEEEIVILTATSGDTGKAAMEGFCDVPGTRIMVFYPRDGVSEIQRRQMVTQRGDNTRVVGIHGNFDEAQTGVKRMFTDEDLAERLKDRGFVFSSANSINIGRLVPQIVYYVSSYVRLLRDKKINSGDQINIVVPTGNFGNILAAHYARHLGLPVDTLVCASNSNNVLTEFFRDGKYDKNREFILTSSPSMDILVSSNLERLVFELGDMDDAALRERMSSLDSDGVYHISPEMLDKLMSDKDFLFVGGFATEEAVAETIRSIYEENGYVTDPHTAVASCVYGQLKDRLKGHPTLIASTASPYKFTRSVMQALGREDEGKTDMELTDDLCEIAKVPVPPAIEDIKTAPVRHDYECEPSEMEAMVLDFLKDKN